MEKQSLNQPQETGQPAEKIKFGTVEVDGKKFTRVTAAPGWKWSVDLKPVLKTDSCPTDHLLYMISGKMAVKMDDGEEMEFASGDLAHIPPGHDGWGIGDEPTVWLEIPH